MLRKCKQRLGIGMVAFLLTATAWAQGDIVDTAYVEQAVTRGAIVWDVRKAADYVNGHIPGAVNFGSVKKVLRDTNREELLSVSKAEKILGAAGFDPVRKEVIIYSRKGDPSAYYGLHAIKYYGAKQAKVYHGGLDEWRAAGKPVTKEVTKLPPISVQLSPQASLVVWNKEMLERVRAGGAQILDVRTPKEYAADDIRAVRGGHVPGAVNIPYQQNWQDPKAAAKLKRKEVKTRDGMALKAEADLRTLYAKLDPNKETIVYCQSGVRASQSATILRALGFRDVKVYEPSWLGYAGMLAAPAENEVFVNVGALNRKIASLEGQVKSLRGELTKLKAKSR